MEKKEKIRVWFLSIQFKLSVQLSNMNIAGPDLVKLSREGEGGRGGRGEGEAEKRRGVWVGGWLLLSLGLPGWHCPLLVKPLSGGCKRGERGGRSRSQPAGGSGGAASHRAIGCCCVCWGHTLLCSVGDTHTGRQADHQYTLGILDRDREQEARMLKICSSMHHSLYFSRVPRSRKGTRLGTKVLQK